MKKEEPKQPMMNVSASRLRRITNNFCNAEDDKVRNIDMLEKYAHYLGQEAQKEWKQYKVAMCFICLNAPYWQFAKDAIEGARAKFLPDHNIDFFLWSDMPEDTHYGATVFPTEGVQWPLPTLMRYHLMLQQEEKLKEYDYVFYCDIDMRFLDIVGDEVLADGITAAAHPMYHFRPGLRYPVEPNPLSASYIPMPRNYYAGGFQGGTAESFIKAMKSMKRMIDADFAINYTPIWNDESAWNKYLMDNPPAIYLSPSYIYPDSLVEQYYVKIWGRDFIPKLMTLTKQFTTSTEGGDSVREMISTM